MNKEFLENLLRPVVAWAQAHSGDSEHLRFLVLALSALAFIALVLAANSGLDASAQSLRRAQAERINLARQLAEGSWEERDRQSEAMRLALSQRFWSAETAGLAEATLERWLRERADKYGLKPDLIRVQRSNIVTTGADGADASVLQGGQRMSAKMTLPFQPEAVMRLLDDASRNDKMLMVDRLFIRSGRNALVEIDFSTLIRLDDSVPAAR